MYIRVPLRMSTASAARSLREKRKRYLKSTYFLYLLLLIVLPCDVFDVPAAPFRNFGLGRLLRLFVFRLLGLLGLVDSLGHSHNVHRAVSVGDHHLDGLCLDVLVEISRVDRQVKIVLTAYVIDRGALIVRHAHAVVVVRRRGSEAAFSAAVELIIAIKAADAAVRQDLIIGSGLLKSAGTKLLAIWFLVNGITIGVALRRRGERGAAVCRGCLDFERLFIVLEVIKRGAVSASVSVTVATEAVGGERMRRNRHGIRRDTGRYNAARSGVPVMIVMMNVLLDARRAGLMQNHLLLIDQLVLVIELYIGAVFVYGFGQEWRWSGFLVHGIRPDETGRRRRRSAERRSGVNGPRRRAETRWQRWERHGFRRTVGRPFHRYCRKRTAHRLDSHRLSVDDIVRMNIAVRRIVRTSSFRVLAL